MDRYHENLGAEQESTDRMALNTGDLSRRQRRVLEFSQDFRLVLSTTWVELAAHIRFSSIPCNPTVDPLHVKLK